jgi:hypothetical protein
MYRKRQNKKSISKSLYGNAMDNQKIAWGKKARFGRKTEKG